MSRKKKRNKKQSQPKSAFTPIPRERALIPLEKKTLVAQEAAVEVPASAKKKRRLSGRVALRARHRRAGHTRRRVVLSAALVFTLGVAAVAVFVLDVPHWQKLDPLKLTRLSQTSRLYDNEGSLVTKLRGAENRTLVSLSEVPVAVRAAFIAAEDLRFYEHNGFDLVRIFGALVADLKSQSFSQGASTITQQLVKLTHLTNEKTIARKAEELYLAIQLEQAFDKDEILEMYLNTVYFGNSAYGIQAAAEYYFAKDVSELTAAEGAALAATIKAPSAYSLTDGPEANRTRRNYILTTMEENGMLPASEAAAARAQELTAARNTPATNVYGWYVDAALEEAEALLGITADQLLTGGYYIETALNQPLQAIADALFADDGNFPDNASDGTPVQGALAVADTKTGALLALVGGRDYTTARGFNRATQMRRQPGSAIKPLAVYAPAIQAGYTAASIVLDEQEDFGGGYTPRNSGNLYYGNVTLRRALALSLNVATVRLMSEIGISRSTAFLEKAGIPLTDTDGNLSLALGSMTTGVTPAELAASYAMFGNQGVYNPPYIVTRIFAPTGEKLYEHEAAPRTVLSSQDAYLLTSMMRSVTSWGTGAKLSATGLAVAGKTGTVSLVGQSGNRDIWMAAYTSDFSLACWMGFDVTDANHHLPSRQSGGDATAAMATSFLKKAYANRQKPSFPEPEGLVWLTIDTIAGQVTGYPMLASSATPESYKLSEVFLASNRPWSTSNVWQSPSACSYFYVEFNDSGMPRLKFGCTDTALYRISRTVGGETVVLTELLGSAGESVSYVDWSATPGEWYTYSVTPVQSTLLAEGVELTGPTSRQSVQARYASGLFGGALRKLVGF